MSEREAVFRAAFERSLDGMLITNDDGRFVDANAAACELFGRSREEILSATFHALSAKVDAVLDERWRSFLTAGAATGEWQLRRPDGDTRVLQYTSIASVAPGQHLSIVRDVTAARRAEEMFAKAFRASPVPLAIATTPACHVLDINEAALRLLGRTRADTVGKTGPEIGLWGDPAERERIHREYASAGAVREFHTRVRHGSGELLDVVLSLEPIEVRGQACVLTVMVDVTRQTLLQASLREAQERLHQIQKMEAIGTLAGGIAHDFNNILSVILTCSTMVEQSLQTGAPATAEQVVAVVNDARAIRQAAERAATLTRQLLAFSRRQVVAPRVVDLGRVIASMETMLRRLLGEQIALVAAPGSPGNALIDPIQLEQIILDLAVNARDAMPGGGRLVIECEPVDADGALVAGTGAQPGPYVRIRVSDTGVGMDEATRARVFEPYFTTTGQGGGLGLATVFGIVQQSGGFLRVASERGRGTTVEVYIPRTERAPEHEPGTVAALGLAPPGRR